MLKPTYKDVINDTIICKTSYHFVLYLKITVWGKLPNMSLTFLSVSTEEYSALGKRNAIVATSICTKDKTQSSRP